MQRRAIRATRAIGIGPLLALLALPSCGGFSATVEDEPLPAVCEPYTRAESGTQAAVFAPSPRTPAESTQVGAPGPGPVTAWAHPPFAIVNAVVMTAAGVTYENGYVYVVDGRIDAVGPGPFEAPASAGEVRIIDAGGRYLTPGLIDSHSHLGVYPAPFIEAHSDGNEATAPITAEVQAIHSIWPQDPGFGRALAAGVTSLQVLPGSANLIGGRGVTLKLHHGARVPEEMRFPGAPDGLKMACGENPKRVYGNQGGPATRMGSIARMRAAWLGAQEYAESLQDYQESLQSWCEEGANPEEEPDQPSRDLGRETLAAALGGEILVHVHCYRADEMLVQLEMADEFGYTIRSFHHAVESYKIRDILAERGIATSTWADWWGFKIEAFDAIPENAGLLAESGARAIIHSDSAIGIQHLNQEAAKAYYAALDAGVEVGEDDALRWITLNPAWALGVDEQTGSIEVGKMADLVVWSGHPFSIYSSPDLVFIDGVLEHDRVNPGPPWSDFEVGLWPEGVAP